MRLLHTQNGKRHSTLLTSRERRDLLKTRQTGDAEGSEMTSVFLLGLTGEFGGEEGDGGEGEVEGIDVLWKEEQMKKKDEEGEGVEY